MDLLSRNNNWAGSTALLLTVAWPASVTAGPSANWAIGAAFLGGCLSAFFLLTQDEAREKDRKGLELVAFANGDYMYVFITNDDTQAYVVDETFRSQ